MIDSVKGRGQIKNKYWDDITFIHILENEIRHIDLEGLKTSFMQWYVEKVWYLWVSFDRIHKISLVDFKKWSF